MVFAISLCTYHSVTKLVRYDEYWRRGYRRTRYSLRPSLNASQSTTSGVVLVAGAFIFAAAARYSENPGTEPGWLIPGGRLEFFVASFSFALCAEMLRCEPSVLALIPAPLPPHSRQPTHLPIFDNSWLCCCCCEDASELWDRRLPTGDEPKLSRRRVLLLFVLPTDNMGRAVTILLPVTDDADPSCRIASWLGLDFKVWISRPPDRDTIDSWDKARRRRPVTGGQSKSVASPGLKG